MDEADLALRRVTYAMFVEVGRAPTLDDVAAECGVSADEARAGWQRLHDAHAIVLRDASTLRMANPFSAEPTPHRVHAGGRAWFANCAWDAFGIGAALGTDSVIETSCPDCNAELRIDVDGGEPSDRSLLFHCLLPAEQWWDDIGFT